MFSRENKIKFKLLFQGPLAKSELLFHHFLLFENDFLGCQVVTQYQQQHPSNHVCNFIFLMPNIHFELMMYFPTKWGAVQNLRILKKTQGSNG